jgi:hypothetical protein
MLSKSDHWTVTVSHGQRELRERTPRSSPASSPQPVVREAHPDRRLSSTSRLRPPSGRRRSLLVSSGSKKRSFGWHSERTAAQWTGSSPRTPHKAHTSNSWTAPISSVLSTWLSARLTEFRRRLTLSPRPSRPSSQSRSITKMTAWAIGPVPLDETRRLSSNLVIAGDLRTCHNLNPAPRLARSTKKCL